jgi:hypothetical protein
MARYIDDADWLVGDIARHPALSVAIPQNKAESAQKTGRENVCLSKWTRSLRQKSIG